MAENFLIPTKDPKPQIQEVLSSQGMIKTKKTSILYLMKNKTRKSQKHPGSRSGGGGYR